MTDSITTQTVGEFFAELPAGTYVRVSSDAVGVAHVWTGAYTADNQLKLVATVRGCVVTQRLAEPNRWQVVTDQYETPIVAGDFAMMMIRTYLAQTAHHEGAAQREFAMEGDWKRLNEFLNDYAKEHNLCPDFESRLQSWNCEFRHFKLEGRGKEYWDEIEARWAQRPRWN